MKKLKELNKEELKKVFKNNSKLQEDVFNDMYDNADFWNSEYLNCWQGGIDYCIGYDRGSYFNITDKYKFLDGLKLAQKNYGFLYDKYNDLIDYAEKLYNKLLYIGDELSEENYQRLDNRIYDLFEKLEAACYKCFMDNYEYCFNNDEQFLYFYEFYIDCRIDENEFYIDEDYILFKHIEYEKCYK